MIIINIYNNIIIINRQTRAYILLSNKKKPDTIDFELTPFVPSDSVLKEISDDY